MDHCAARSKWVTVTNMAPILKHLTLSQLTHFAIDCLFPCDTIGFVTSECSGFGGSQRTLWDNHGEDKEREEAGYAELRGDGEVPGGTFGMDGAEKAGGDMPGAVDPCFSGDAMSKLRVWALSLTKPPFSPALCWLSVAQS